LQALDPMVEGLSRRPVQPFDLLRGELRGEPKGRQAGRMQDFVGIRVADPVEQMRIGEGALERMRFTSQGGAELSWRRAEHVEASRVVRGKPLDAAQQVQRCAVLRPRFRQEQAPARKIPGGEAGTAGNPHAGRLPVESARDHQMENGEQVVLESEDDALAETLDLEDHPTGEVRGWW